MRNKYQSYYSKFYFSITIFQSVTICNRLATLLKPVFQDFPILNTKPHFYTTISIPIFIFSQRPFAPQYVLCVLRGSKSPDGPQAHSKRHFPSFLISSCKFLPFPAISRYFPSFLFISQNKTR